MYTVLLTTNFSESARNAMVYAVNLFGAKNTEYIIMNTFIDSPTGNDGFLSAEDLERRGKSEELEADKAFLQTTFPDLNLEISTTSAYGSLTSAINEMVEKYSANYVVIGNKEKYNFEAGLLRAKTYELIRNIECPVLAVPDGRKFMANEGGLVFASDLKTIKKPDHLEPLLRIAASHGVPVKTIHIRKPNSTDPPSEGGTQLEKIFGDQPIEKHELEHEDVLEGIRSFVESHGSSLLVLLARKQNFFQRLTQTSLTKEMSKISSMPLLILHDY